MLHILFMILKIIGILILIFLLLVLLVMAAVLLIPVRYQAAAEKKESQSPAAQGTITWFLRLFSITVGYQKETGFDFSMKVLGRILFGKNRNSGERSRDYLDDIEEAEEDAGKPEDIPTTYEPVNPAHLDDASEDSAQADAVQGDNSLTDVIFESSPSFGEKDAGETVSGGETMDGTGAEAEEGGETEFRERKKDPFSGNSFQKVSDTVRNLKDKVSGILNFLQNESTRGTWRHLTRELGYLFRHYKPRRLEGTLRFGMDDPAVTGEILGILCVISAFCGNTLQVEADFEQPVLEGNIYLKGHIRVCHAVKAFLCLLLDRDVRKTIAKIRRMTRE